MKKKKIGSRESYSKSRYYIKIFHLFHFLSFSPQTKGAEIKLTAELRIECIEAGVHEITAALTRYLASTVGLFEQQYVKLQYARKYDALGVLFSF